MSFATWVDQSQPITFISVLSTDTTGAARNVCAANTTISRPQCYLQPAGNWGMYAGTVADGGIAASAGNWQVVRFYFNNTTSNVRVNGTTGSNVTTGTGLYTAAQGFRVGLNPTANQYFDGYISELYVYAGTFTSQDNTDIEAYINGVYSVF